LKKKTMVKSVIYLLLVRDSESCWFTEEICTYMRCWESPGDLPLVIEIVVSFRSFRCAPLAPRDARH
jgi:hypothetical protein